MTDITLSISSSDSILVSSHNPGGEISDCWLSFLTTPVSCRLPVDELPPIDSPIFITGRVRLAELISHIMIPEWAGTIDIHDHDICILGGPLPTSDPTLIVKSESELETAECDVIVTHIFPNPEGNYKAHAKIFPIRLNKTIMKGHDVRMAWIATVATFSK